MLLFAGISIFSSATMHGQSPVTDGTVFATIYANDQNDSTHSTIGGVVYEIDGSTAKVDGPSIASFPANGEIEILSQVVINSQTYDVTSIADAAFYRFTELQSIVLGSIVSIGEAAFEGCENLTVIEIPSSVEYIEGNAFKGSGLESIIVASENDVYTSGNGCNCIVEIDTKKLICGCKNTTIPNGTIEICENAFRDCNGLTNIDLTGVRTIGDFAFYGCRNLFDLNLTEVETIGDWAFGLCNGIIDVVIPDSVTSIGDCAFNGADMHIESIVILGNDTALGQRVFFWESTGRPPRVSWRLVDDIAEKVIYVPDESVEYYKEALNWSAYADIIKPLSEKPSTGVIADIVLPSVIIATLCATLAYVSLGGKGKRI